MRSVQSSKIWPVVLDGAIQRQKATESFIRRRAKDFLINLKIIVHLTEFCPGSLGNLKLLTNLRVRSGACTVHTEHLRKAKEKIDLMPL